MLNIGNGRVDKDYHIHKKQSLESALTFELSVKLWTCSVGLHTTQCSSAHAITWKNAAVHASATADWRQRRSMAVPWYLFIALDLAVLQSNFHSRRCGVRRWAEDGRKNWKTGKIGLSVESNRDDCVFKCGARICCNTQSPSPVALNTRTINELSEFKLLKLSMHLKCFNRSAEERNWNQFVISKAGKGFKIKSDFLEQSNTWRGWIKQICPGLYGLIFTR